ncbi:efflux RND transporter periplasmic adaptor subunit [Nitrincola nitratireducens]|uniref:Putative efflux pump periplasmic linker ttgA n=1 Tax=Nitrincola nitratireducens TaxID=1229521 RepID=W9VJE4_9GAMM|nr:efflux RND transporter periplasmic adaptor subunit [Nitrincola nitratireducens]EXJ10685.1 putative efflux pump periplasmic linker ttgA precursor [Nitrincola nitratireducens]
MDLKDAQLSPKRRGLVSIIAAGLASLLLIIWIMSGNTYQSVDPDQLQAKEVESTVSNLPKVQTHQVAAKTFTPTLILQGTLSPYYQAQVYARTSSQIQERPATLGQWIEQGDVLVRLDPETRRTLVQKAEADVHLHRSELEAGERLFKNRLLSEHEKLRLKATAAASEAALADAKLALAHTQINAPIAGFVNSLPFEIGELVQSGDVIATLTDTRNLKVKAYVAQQDVGRMGVGNPVKVTLLDGHTFVGEITFIANLADTATRSYAIEAKINNPEGLRIAGASATLEISLPEVLAHRIPPSLLSLDPSGQVGILGVNNEQVVVFHPLTLISFDTEYARVIGLPDTLEIITLGAGFTQPGDKVEPHLQESPL